MLFHYSAAEASGKLTDADYEADNLDQVLQFLRGKGLRPLKIDVVNRGKTGFSIFKKKISVTDKVFLTKYLALMLRVGTDLLSAVNILITDFDKPAVREFLVEVRENLTHGQPFWKSFEAHPETFSVTFTNLIRAAELSGNLQKTFEQLSVSTQSEAELKGRIKGALIYPVILLVAASGIMMFLVTFALPKISAVFSSGGIKPPTFSRIVFGVGLFINSNLTVLIIAFIIVVGGGGWWGFTTETGKKAFQRFLTSLPVIRGIYQEIALQQMASTMNALMRAGLPIMQTISIAADTVGYHVFRDALLRISNEGLAKGLTIGEAFRREHAFPKTVTNLIAVSEEAGHLDEVLQTLSEFYAAEIDTSIKTLMSLLEPAMLLGMGVMVAVIALAIIVPIYQLTTQF